MVRTLHLIKHGRPHIDPQVPAHDWPLAQDALTGLPTLLAALHPRPDLVACSVEPNTDSD